MAVLPIGAVGASPFVAPTLSAPATAGPSFGSMLSDGVKGVEASQAEASKLSAELATGDLENIHDFTTAAAKAQLGVQLTATLRNRAVEAYQEIMRMQL